MNTITQSLTELKKSLEKLTEELARLEVHLMGLRRQESPELIFSKTLDENIEKYGSFEELVKILEELVPSNEKIVLEAIEKLGDSDKHFSGLLRGTYFKRKMNVYNGNIAS